MLFDSSKLGPINIRGSGNNSSKRSRRLKKEISPLTNRSLNIPNFPYTTKTSRKLTKFFYPFQKDTIENRNRENRMIKKKLIKINQNYSLQKNQDKIYLKNLIKRQKINYDNKYGKLKNDLNKVLYLYRKKNERKFLIKRNYKLCFKKKKKINLKIESFSIINFKKNSKKINHFIKKISYFSKTNSKIISLKKINLNEKKSSKFRKKSNLLKKLKARVFSIIFIKRIKLSLEEKRKKKIEIYQNNYSDLQKKLLNYFSKKLKPILKVIWDNKKNLCFLKNKRKLEKLNYYYKMDFQKNINKSSLENSKKIIDKILKLLNFSKKFWKEIKDLSKKIFKGKENVFPNNFFFDFELKKLKINFHGFLNLEKNEHSSFIFFIYIIGKFLLSIISKPLKYLNIKNTKNNELILINTIFICSILENLILKSLEKFFKLKNLKNDIKENFQLIPRPKFYLSSKKLIKISSFGKNENSFFEDSINISYLDIFFENKDINFTFITIEKFIFAIKKNFED